MRSNGFQITGNELQAMVNERLLGAKAAIPATTRCLTRAEVMSYVHVYGGPQDPYVPSIPYTTWPIGGGVYQFGADPYLTCSYEYINALQATGSIYFEMNQEGNPYLNADLFGQVNGSPLRLDPGSNLDGMFFGGPQYSPNMSSAVRIGNQITVQANFGLATPDGVSYGWDAPGYGFLQVFANGALINDQSVFKNASFAPNLTELTHSFIVQAGTNYYVKAWSLVAYPYITRYSSTSAIDACTAASCT